MVFLENTSSFKSLEPVNWILICEKCRSVVSNFFATPWTVVCQAPLSMEFSRQEYWSGQPFPSPGDHPDPGIKPMSSTLQADSLLSVPPGKPIHEMGPCKSNYLQMWSSQIIQVGPKSHDKHSYKRPKRRRSCEIGVAELGVMWLKAKEDKECWQHLEAEDTWRILPQNLQREAGLANTLNSDFWPPEMWENRFLWFKPADLWLFVVAATGNLYIKG